jgi:hypothetical protein
MLMPTDAAAKLKEGGVRQVGRFNLRGDRIGFNNAAASSTPPTFADTNLKVKHYNAVYLFSLYFFISCFLIPTTLGT